MYRKLLPLLVVIGLFSFVLIPFALPADAMQDLDKINSTVDRWKKQSFLIKLLIFTTGITGTLIAAMQQSASHRIKIASQILGISITMITGANFFLYNFDYKSLDYWIIQIENRREEIMYQYSPLRDSDGKFSDAQVAEKYRNDLLELVKLVGSARLDLNQKEKVSKHEKTALIESVISSAFAAPPKPSWIDNPPKDDNNNLYGLGTDVSPDLKDAVQKSKTNAMKKIEEKILNIISAPELSSASDSLGSFVNITKDIEKNAMFKEFFVKKNGGYEVFTLGIYPRVQVKTIEDILTMIREMRALAAEERQFQLGVAQIQDLPNLANRAHEAKKSMNQQLGISEESPEAQLRPTEAIPAEGVQAWVTEATMLWDGPSKTAPLKDTLPKGTPLRILSVENGWYFVTSNKPGGYSPKGWVEARHVTRNSPQ